MFPDAFDQKRLRVEETDYLFVIGGAGPPLLLLHGFPQTHQCWDLVAPARVAYRMALDHPHKITRLGVLNIIPTIEQFERMSGGPSLGYWPWYLLAGTRRSFPARGGSGRALEPARAVPAQPLNASCRSR